MTEEYNAKLLIAYKFAIEASQDGISDVLEDVILAVMNGGQGVTLRGGMVTTPAVPYDNRNIAIRTGMDHSSREVES